MTNKLINEALKRSTQGKRNGTGFWLACQLRDRGCTEAEAEDVMLEYTSQLGGNGAEPYTRTEAIATLKSAFSKLPRVMGAGGRSNNGKLCQPVNTKVKQARNRVDTLQTNYTNSVNGVNGLTLAAIAEAKHLPVDFLKSLGVNDFKLNALPVVRIPYPTEDGQEVAVRFRLALSGNLRFRWRKGDHAIPYGLNRLEQIRKTGWVLIVEGESDCWTCWLNG
ncbi:primase C-terminal domain-containing protein, partial [Chloroflexota bacterium]